MVMPNETETQLADEWRTLEQSWRKVASTHNLQALLSDAAPNHTWSTWKRRIVGVMLLGTACVLLTAATWTLIVVKLMPHMGLPFLDKLYNDWYYCLLVPLTLPTTAVAVGLNWFCLKLFKHNS
uniref:Transmembrane protein n=1 Tax=Chlamydomonas chlamydogama TaxID=225041 RepID=A0A7S2QUV1_9CHLO|mmetsp:Transcript_70/g.111  ORF Transcript_70/g.111 Transcript_70/m.111 type:complete len:124 (+) Transcript_70:201-572(+)